MSAEQGPPFGSFSLDVRINISVQLTWLDICCLYFILIFFFQYLLNIIPELLARNVIGNPS